MNEFGLHNATGMPLIYTCHSPLKPETMHEGVLPPATYGWQQRYHANPVIRMIAPENELICLLSAAGPMTSPNAPSTTLQFNAQVANNITVGCSVAGACACDAASFIYSGQFVPPGEWFHCNQ